MPTVLEKVKSSLRVTHSADDDLLNRLVESATLEYCRFTNTTTADVANVEVEQDALNGIILMVQADYDGDAMQRDKFRAAAEALWVPYRSSFGV